MITEIIKDSFLDEEEHIYSLDSGLKIIIIPKKGFAKTTAMFAVNFGSVVNTFKGEDEKNYTRIPDGVAHFLEHKLFESEQGDAFTLYAKTGANANAYTSFNVTNYYFSSTNRLKENLEILINLIGTPYFTDENVNKEQGIIGQEINMYLDSPGWRVYFNMLQAMYEKNPVRYDIAGSVESISKITPKLLYDCYNKFYTPENMVLTVVGDVCPEEIFKFASEKVKRLGTEKNIAVKTEKEPESILSHKAEQKLSVSMPLFAIGFKDKPAGKGKDLVRKEIIGRMALDIVFGKSGDFFDECYNMGLINDSYGIDFECEPNFCHSMIQGESETPDEVLKRVVLYAKRRMDEGITYEELSTQKNIEKSMFIKDFNRVENVARNAMEAYFGGYGLFDVLEVIESITKEDIDRQLKKFTEENSVLSVIRPEQN